MNIENSFTWKSVVSFVAFNLTFWLTNWILFKKAKQPGWAAITPVYGFLVYAKIAKANKYAALFAGTLYMVGQLSYFATQDPLSATAFSGHDILGGIMVGAMVAEVIISVYLFLKFYGKYKINEFYWLAYLFFPIVSLVFAHKAKYIGEVAKNDTQD